MFEIRLAVATGWTPMLCSCAPGKALFAVRDAAQVAITIRAGVGEASEL